MPDQLSQVPPGGHGESTEPRALHPRDVERAKRVRLVIGASAILLVLALSAYVAYYFAARESYLLIDAAGFVLGLVCVAVAGRFARRSEHDVASYWLLAGAGAIYAFGELVWVGETLFNVLGGVLLILIIGGLVLRRQWTAWLIAIALYLLFVLLVNEFQPLPRARATGEARSVTLTIHLVLTGTYLLLLLWQVIRAFRTGYMRTRLLISFVAVVLVPAVIILTASVLAGLLAGRQRAISQLVSVATLKEAAIRTWLSTLEADLDSVLAEETEGRHALTLLQQSPNAAAYQSAHEQLQGHFLRTIDRSVRFETIMLLDSQGTVVLSSDPELEGRSYRGFAFFQRGLESAQAQLTSEMARWWLDSVRPIVDQQGRTLGILAGRATLATLNDTMLERTGLGGTGETYLVSPERAMLTQLRSEERVPYAPRTGPYAAIEDERASGSGLYDNYEGDPVVGVYHWVPELRVALLAEQHQTEAFRVIYSMLFIDIGVTVVAVFVAAAVSLVASRGIASPLSDLADTATQIASGDLRRAARIERHDEIGALAQAFNEMTAQLRGMFDTLEQTVVERTHALEQRSVQLEAAAQVAREAAGIRDVGELLDQTVHLISERFGFYHAGIFLLDEPREYAVLRAASSQGGHRMLARSHKLRIGEVGIVGDVAGSGQPRVALDVGADAMFFDNPDLPETRSEMALALAVREQVIGVLDVQSKEPEAFSEEDVAILQTMADQVALAIENARLLRESERALRELETLYGRRVQDAWRERLGRQAIAFRYMPTGVQDTPAPPEPGLVASDLSEPVVQERADGYRLVSPIRLRGETLGSIALRREPGERVWSAEEIGLVREVSSQVALALDNARLLDEAQRHAERDRLIADITARVRSSMHLESILQTAVRELGTALGTDRVSVKLTGVPAGQPTEGGDGDATPEVDE